MSVSDIIAQELKKADIATLALKTGICESTLRNYRRQSTNMSVEYVECICKCLHLKLQVVKE